MTLDGPIGPALSDWFVRSLEEANKASATLFVLQLNTPGGLDSAMRDMIRRARQAANKRTHKAVPVMASAADDADGGADHGAPAVAIYLHALPFSAAILC